MVVVAKRMKSNGYWVNDCYRFELSTGCMACDSGKMFPTVSHYINNNKGTYCRTLSTKQGISKDEGNEMYKDLLAKGYKVISTSNRDKELAEKYGYEIMDKSEVA